ncbi:MAG TPA: dockerin type I repeat-containing protein [Patescibacteria group bacterium]|nr:dockerin type I repeat-containing protein [Patescibacteria group bacterium]
MRVRAQSAGRTYYVDCSLGDDAKDGLSASTAWRSVGKANAVNLNPGDSLLFKRGCMWSTTSDGALFTAKWNGTATAPITIGAYGDGNKPLFRSDAHGSGIYSKPIEVSGTYQVIDGLRADLINPFINTGCTQADGTGMPVGWYTGITVNGSYNTVQNVEVSNMANGIFTEDTSTHNKVLHSYVHDLHMFTRVDATKGALGVMGVLIQGDDNEIAYNRFDNNYGKCTLTGGISQEYSAPFELYNANRSFVHHNSAFEHKKHFEMGKDSTHTADDNILAYNLFVSSRTNAVGPNIHGAGSSYGPVNRTQIYNNTIVFTGTTSQAIVCGCDGGATVKNNIFVAEWKAAYYSGTIAEGNNIYWDYQKTTDSSADPFVQFAAGTTPTAISTTSKKLDPLFISLTDFHLQSVSPAVDSGVSVGYSQDLDNSTVPRGGAPDIGAYEFGSTAVSPSPAATSVPNTACVSADLNSDNTVNSSDDAILLGDLLKTPASNPKSDINKDGTVDIIDYSLMTRVFGQTCQ